MDINKEVLKGHTDTLILSLLSQKELYGYELAKIVRDKTQNQFELKEGTLYLSLKRLEKNTWIESYWGDEQGVGGRRKYYRLTVGGTAELKQRKLEWQNLKTLMDLFLEGGSE